MTIARARRDDALAGCILATLLAVMGCASSTAVTRNVGGRLVRGRFVTDEAYTAYLRGALFEAQGNREAALVAYTEGARRDPDSPELLTKIGALICQRRDDATSSSGKPATAFERAAAIDPAYEEAWTERARCHLKRGELASAERAARLAVATDPGRIEAALLLALVLEHEERIDEAGKWLHGLVIREPASIEAQQAMAAFAERVHDDARRAAAEHELALLGARPNRRSAAEKVRTSVADIDAAMAKGAFDEAGRLALSSRLSSGKLALRAAAAGAAAFAKNQGELVLAADPGDSDARVAVAIAADLLRDDDGLARAMQDATLATTPISPLATLLMAELLERRVGPDAKKVWVDVAGAPTGDSDALALEVAKRH